MKEETKKDIGKGVLIALVIISGVFLIISLGSTERIKCSQDLCSIEPYSSSSLCYGNITLEDSLQSHFNKYQGNNDWGTCYT